MRIPGIRRAFRIPRFTRSHIEREVDDELAFHIERRAEKLHAAGLSPEAAALEATKRFGEVDQVRAECIDVEISDHRRETFVTFFDQLFADLRFTVRSLRHARAFTAVALITLILGIASVTSIFSYFDAVYYGELPYRDAKRIVALSEQRPSGYFAFSKLSLDAVRALRRPLRSFERVAAYDEHAVLISSSAEPQQIRTIGIDTSFIGLFGVRPQLGRNLLSEEIASDASVTMISDVLWQSRYGRDSSVIGKAIGMDDRQLRIVGVLPPAFRFPYQTDAITPLREVADSGATTSNTFVSLVAKLKPGATREGARAEMGVVAKQLAAIDSRAYRGMALVVRDEMLDRKVNNFLPYPSVFLGAGFFLLLIACTNVMSLFYVRAAQRRGEMAIRSSLGAGRSRLVRHALTESLLISAVAALFGTMLAQWLVRLWLHFVPTQGFPSWFHVAIDYRVLAFTIGVTVFVTIIVGLSPAREGTRFDLVRALKGAGDGGSSSERVTRGSKRGLVVQLGLSMSLFISAALLVRSFQKLTTIDFGFPADRIALVQPLFDRRYQADHPRALRFATDIAARAAAMPGVTGTAVRGAFTALRGAVMKADLVMVRRYDPRVIPDGDSTRAVRTERGAISLVVSDDYFNLLGLKIRAGRSFSNADAEGGPTAAVIGVHTAKLLWGNAPAVGRTIQLDIFEEPMTVIGVVDDVRNLRGGYRGFNADPEITAYVSTRQALSLSPEILARGSNDVLEMRARIVNLVRADDPMLLLMRGTTLASQLDEAFLVTKVFGGIIAALAVAALALSVVGIYGVVAFGIAQRTRELGIRLALGGSSQAVMKLILSETLRFVAVGLSAGLALALLLGRVLKIFLFGVSPLDPLTYVVVTVLFGAVALAASWWPARRVTRIDPLVALRSD